MRLTEADIQEINSKVKDSWNEGIYTEPNYIPVHIKEPVIYMRWDARGASGGSCWDEGPEDGAQPYENDKPEFTVLDLVLKKIKPDLSYLEFRDVQNLIRTNSDTESEYYGNYTEWEVEYIILSDLYKLLNL